MNNRKLLVIALGAAALVLTLCGCTAEQLPPAVSASGATPEATTVAAPVSVNSKSTTVVASESSFAEEPHERSIASTQIQATDQKPKLGPNGLTPAIVGELIKSVGKNRAGVVELMGIPTRTVALGQHDQLKCWTWDVKNNNRPDAEVTVESRDEDKEVYNVTIITITTNLTCSQISGYLGDDEPTLYWMKYFGTEATEFGVVAKSRGGAEVRLVARASSPIVDEHRSLDEEGNLVKLYSRSSSFDWKMGLIKRLSAGEEYLLPHYTTWPKLTDEWTELPK
ncbi:MAG: hypothetical protein AAB669_00580 [Patescibacteria group bacterium]